MNTCTKCNFRIANPGRKWCQTCFLDSKSQNVGSQMANISFSSSFYGHHSQEFIFEDGDNTPLSLFHMEPFKMDNKIWPSIIHYIEAKSFIKQPASALVAALNTPRDAFQFPRTYSSLIRPDWQDIKINVMRIALKEKFGQNPHLADMLVSTNGKYLSEHTNNDTFWGDNLDDTGHNWLGKLLMELRNDLCNGKKISIQQLNGRINFYEKNNLYYEFTNFFLAPMIVDNIKYPTSEHYFQAQKFANIFIEDFIRSLPTPSGAVELTHRTEFSHLRNPQWKNLRTPSLQEAIFAKVEQSTVVKNALLNTKNARIIYKSNDLYWGMNNGTGKNILGELWIQIRDSFPDK